MASSYSHTHSSSSKMPFSFVNQEYNTVASPPTAISELPVESPRRMHIRDIFPDVAKNSQRSLVEHPRNSGTPTSSNSPQTPPIKHRIFGLGHSSPRPWESTPRRRAVIPKEHADGWRHTRTRIVQAVTPILDLSGDLLHQALVIGVEVLPYAPIPGLDGAAKLLLGIWDSVEGVESNRLACLRLTERCADILIAIREEITKVGDDVEKELHVPMIKLKETFFDIYLCIERQKNQPFLTRFLKKDDLLREIDECNTALGDCLDHFDRSILLRLMGNISRLSAASPSIPAKQLISPSCIPEDDLDAIELPVQSFARDPAAAALSQDEIRRMLRQVLEQQNERDRNGDLNDLRSLLRSALDTDSDSDMIKVLQIGRLERPEAIKTLLRALEQRIQEDNSYITPPSSASPRTRALTWPVDQSRGSRIDLLEREFIEREIEALKRQVGGTPVNLPSWTITKYEIELGHPVGRSHNSFVYRGTWRHRDVAVKVLDTTTHKNTFANEVSIWKILKHPNVLELLGASSADGGLPWFLVSPYMRNGSLSDYLKRQLWDKGHDEAAFALVVVDSLKMMHDIAKGMEYLHGHRIVHGDLRASNIVVDDYLNCLVTDFGQSKYHAHIKHTDPQPAHSIRWQAPEVMAGRSLLTKEMDIYAFAISCVEILNMGGYPWPSLHDDAVRRLVLEQNKRPSYPLKVAQILGIHDVLQLAWHDSPGQRPPFEDLVLQIAKLRGIYVSTVKDVSPRIVISSVDALDIHSPVSPSGAGEEGSLLLNFRDSGYASPSLSPFSRPDAVQTLEPFGNELFDSRLLGFETSVKYAPDTRDTRDELVYRLCLSHEFSRSLTLPLWTPSDVALGDIGYMSKPDGQFVRLFNALDPYETSGQRMTDVLDLAHFGSVSEGSQALHRRSISKRGLETLAKVFALGDSPNSPTIVHKFGMTETKSAVLISEKTVYRYFEEPKTLKRWFKAYWRQIWQTYAKEHVLQKEDLIMVVESLSATDYALLVNHGCDEQQAYFEAAPIREPGQPWGTFYGETEGHVFELSTRTDFCSTKISLAGGPSRAVLIARLRFQPDVPDPTLL